MKKIKKHLRCKYLDEDFNYKGYGIL